MATKLGAELDHWLGRTKKNSTWLLVLGILEIIVGTWAIFMPTIAGLAAVVMIAIVLIIGGIARLIEAFMANSFGNGVLAFLWGALVAATGVYLLMMPVVGLATLTLVAAIGIGLDGIFRIVMSFKMRPHKGWGWMLTGGIVSAILAILIFVHFPTSAVWLVGTLIGISVLFNGITMVSIAMAARKLADKGQEALRR
jgi:uncharacterized membrane protein HdeD (DUF308 family)